MRMICIKVWDTEKKEMSTVMPLPMLAGYLMSIYPNLGNEVYLQMTGLKDKTGGWICEGDILENELMGDHWEVRWNEKYGHWELRLPHETGDVCEELGHMKGFTIVGNIYENHELLIK